jgi:hypothetical protein
MIAASPKKPGKHEASAVAGFVIVNFGTIPIEKERH